jgi:hypothetical protein
MTKSKGIGRGGPRVGAGRPRAPEWYQLWLLAIRLGDHRLMQRADEMRRREADRLPIPVTGNRLAATKVQTKVQTMGANQSGAEIFIFEKIEGGVTDGEGAALSQSK